MDLKRLGNSNVSVTPIAFGAWAIGGWMWGGAEENAAIRAIRASYDLGMTTIDTAPVYGFGKSEELVAKAMQGVARDKYQILTKFGLNWEFTQGELHMHSVDNDNKAVSIYRYASKEMVIRECEDCLRRLKTDYLDLFQQHWPDPTTPISETMEALSQLIAQGKIRAAGVCNYRVHHIEEAWKHIQLASNQVPYSMINRGIEKNTVPQALDKGLSIIPYSPLQRGLLTGKIKRDHKFSAGDSRADMKFYKPENIDRANVLLEKIKPIAKAHGATLSQLVINWTTRQPAMDCVLVGARDEQQVKENVKALDFVLSNEDLLKINEAADEFQLAEV